jgi:hypothetical protein
MFYLRRCQERKQQRRLAGRVVYHELEGSGSDKPYLSNPTFVWRD